MKFTIDVKVDSTDEIIKVECCNVLAEHLAKKGV